MRFKKYICTSEKAQKDGWNKEGCLYDMDPFNDGCIYCGVNFDESRTIWYKFSMSFPYWIRRIVRHPHKDIYRQWKYFWQRLFRGFDDSELWSLDYTCAKLMAPRMRAFIDTWGVRSVPCELNISNMSTTQGELDEWRSILEKIYRAFALIVKDNKDLLSGAEHQEIEEGLDLFRKWYYHLWD